MMEEGFDRSHARSRTSKLNTVEVDEFEDIRNIDILEANKDRIVLITRGLSVGNDMLVAVRKLEVFNVKIVPMIGRWSDGCTCKAIESKLMVEGLRCKWVTKSPLRRENEATLLTSPCTEESPGIRKEMSELIVLSAIRPCALME